MVINRQVVPSSTGAELRASKRTSKAGGKGMDFFNMADSSIMKCGDKVFLPKRALRFNVLNNSQIS